MSREIGEQAQVAVGERTDAKALTQRPQSGCGIRPGIQPVPGQIERRPLGFAQALEAGGKALVPLRMYFKDALVKVEVGIGTGKKLFDKREDLKKQVEMRDVQKAMKARRA